MEKESFRRRRREASPTNGISHDENQDVTSEYEDSVNVGNDPGMFTCPDHANWQVFWIRVLYIFAIIFWLFLIYYLQLKIVDIWDVFIILIPFIIFAVAMVYAGNPLSPYNEGMMIRSNYVNSALIVIFPLILWATSKVSNPQQKKFLLMIIVAMIIALLAFYDLWVGEDNYAIAKHARTIFHAISITLLIFALKYFYLDKITDPGGIDGLVDGGNEEYLISSYEASTGQ